MAEKMLPFGQMTQPDEPNGSSVPGQCVDCGNDAYIRLGGENGSPQMLCAHCFVDRARLERLARAQPLPARGVAPRPS
jgi:hypothetical protein